MNESIYQKNTYVPFRTVLRITVFLLLCLLPIKAYAAGSMYDSAYVQKFTHNPKYTMWTIAEPLPSGMDPYSNAEWHDCWYENTASFTTGIASSLQALERGQHYYDKKIQGEVPVGRWALTHETSACIHTGNATNDWEGLVIGNSTCGGAYYSGWIPYCADCDRELSYALIYAPEYAVRTVTYINTKDKYFYRCPSCNHLENEGVVLTHECKAISWNKYRVVYDKNASPLEVVNEMEPSHHMYNNETVFEGEAVTPITHLTMNSYKRMGYAFAGWNTKPDGSGTSYTDGAEIYNLTDENYNKDTGKGVIILYAQWRKQKNTLQIDAKGGTYLGESVWSKVGEYGEITEIDSVNVVGPSGSTVSFNSRGGSSCRQLSATSAFDSFVKKEPFNGRLLEVSSGKYKYSHVAPDLSTDVMEITYVPGSITLPLTVWTGHSFAGWYTKADDTGVFVGMAGDSYTPKNAKETLYAHWVDLVLRSTDNYVANGGRGAVDLTWSQPDMSSKLYRLYRAQAVDGSTLLPATPEWKQIFGANQIGGVSHYEKTITPTDSNRYTIPATGIYQITAKGAQGSAYGTNAGGKGGEITGKFYLTKDTIMMTYVGEKGESGSGGYGAGSGGTGSAYGSGGGGTAVIRRTPLKTFLVAGGGGGGAPNGAGGSGGAETSLRTDDKSNGEDGMTGGGGGYVGGKAGEYIVHNHVPACYKTEVKVGAASQSFYLSGNSPGMASDGPNNTMVGRGQERANQFHWAGRGNGSISFTQQLGNGTTYLATPSSGTLTFGYHMDYVGTNGATPQRYPGLVIQIYNKAGTLIAYNNSPLNYPTGSPVVTSRGEYSNGDEKPEQYTYSYNRAGSNLTVAGSYVGYGANASHGDRESGQVNLTCSATIPANQTGIYIKIISSVATASSGAVGYMDNNITNIAFTYTEQKLICGYTEGQVISSKPGYGGSSFASTDALSVTKTAGVNAGDGETKIESIAIGMFEDSFLNGVEATDYAAPDGINAATASAKALNLTKVRVTFDKPKDNGTTYYFRAESYDLASGNLIGDSNVVNNTLVSEVKGYYIKSSIDRIPGFDINDPEDYTMLLGMANVRTGVDKAKPRQRHTYDIAVPEGNSDKWLYIAAYDTAGNIGPTLEVFVPKKQSWPIFTYQVTIEGLDNNVYSDGVTTYVRGDRGSGNSRFRLSYNSTMEGAARLDYQIDRQNFAISLDTPGETQVYLAKLPLSNPLSVNKTYRGSDMERAVRMTSAILSDASNVSAARKNNGKDNSFNQCFTAGSGLDGRTVYATPVAGATEQGEVDEDGDELIVWSSWADDVLNSISFVVDGKAPDILCDTDLSALGDMSFSSLPTITYTASDELSGVKDFQVLVTNVHSRDSKLFECNASHEVVIDLSMHRALFSGDVDIKATATDNVGNINVLNGTSSEFTLDAKIFKASDATGSVNTLRRGESAVLWFVVTGYADKVVLDFPDELKPGNEDVRTVFQYNKRYFGRDENIDFIIPTDCPLDTYRVTVTAYKDGKVLVKKPALIVVEGDLFEEVRIRIR